MESCEFSCPEVISSVCDVLFFFFVSLCQRKRGTGQREKARKKNLIRRDNKKRENEAENINEMKHHQLRRLILQWDEEEAVENSVIYE